MPYILAFAFFVLCMIVDHKKRASGKVVEPARKDTAGVERTTGKLVFGEHWQAWADAIRREAEEPWEERAA